MDSLELQRAIQKFPLEEYLLDRGVEITGDQEWVLTCPHCAKSKLVVNLEKRAWHCWVCEQLGQDGRGGLVDLLRMFDGLTRLQAARAIVEKSGAHVATNHIPESNLTNFLAGKRLSVVPIQPPPFWRYGAIDFTGILPYCHKRGISRNDVERFGLLWCSEGRYANRLVFPVWEQGQLVYWQARAMWGPGEHSGSGRYIKTLNPPRAGGAAGAGDVLFNIEQAAKCPRVCITEGPIDAVHAGIDAVCTFGKKISKNQIAKLLQAGVRSIDLMWDGPSDTEPMGAWPEMFSAAKELVSLFDLRLVFLPKGDPGDYSRDHLSWFRSNRAKRFEDFAEAPKLNNVSEV